MSRLAGLFLAAALAGGVPACLTADSPAAEPLTLDAAVSMALRDNTELASLRAKWAAMQERPAQAAALPNPMATFSGMDMTDGGSWPDTNEKRVMLEQEIPAFGKRGLREGIARQDAEAMRWELEAMTRDVVMRVKESYFSLYAVERALATLRQEQEVLQRMAKIAETMYATGGRTQQDVLKAKSEITLLKQRALELDTRENGLKAKLNTLFNRRADAALGAAVTPPETAFSGTADQLFATAAMNSPEIRAAQAQVDRYDLEKQLMARESMPDYRLGVEYRNIGNSADMVMFTLGVELPLWRSKIGAGEREAERMRASSEAARETAERNSAFEVQDASFRWRTAQRMFELYKTELIPQAEERFKASETGYQSGGVDFMDFLESQRFLLDIRIMAAMAEGDVGMERARLERAVGAELKTETHPGAAPK